MGAVRRVRVRGYVVQYNFIIICKWAQIRELRQACKKFLIDKASPYNNML
jgi:hypothetical protein